MTTIATATIKAFANDFEDLYPSAVCSGIVGDARHRANGGYHVSLEDQPKSGNYSAVRKLDAAPPGDWPRNAASAVDMSMNTTDMKLLYKRVHAVFLDKTDPRRKHLNAVNCWDGSGDAVRLDFDAQTATYATPDHTWHAHVESHRAFVNLVKAMRAILSILSGESKAAWIAREEPKPAPKPTPKPAPKTHEPGSRTLRLTTPHMTGADVRYVQEWIGEEHCGKADGDYGPKTVAGVRWYQGMRGIKVDGVVGPTTWRQMQVKVT